MTQHQPSEHIVRQNRALAESLPFDDDADFANAERGLIERLSPAIVRDASGRVVWDGESYEFLTGPAPDSVNPSLWRQSSLVAQQGLFEVVPGIYQVRGLDLSNVTFVEGDEGLIVIDPLTSEDPARVALELYRKHRGDRDVVAVIYTHSHADHFGGVLGVTSQADVDAGKVAILAPDGFLEHAISENIYAGTAMARRAGYMYGAALPRGPLGQVGAGLGQTTSTGQVGLIPPTDIVSVTGEIRVIDGVEIEFQMAPGTEAPAEMHFYFPRYRALCMAENATHTLHNLLTLRGALVRDPHEWSRYLTEAIRLFASRSEVAFASHHWPTWGTDDIVDFLAGQRDMYAYLHDQTLRLINKGMTGTEIAEHFTLPPRLERSWHTRGYYGSVSHCVKAIYQRYMGWFDGNPARLWPHEPSQLGPRYVTALGGIDRVLELARTAMSEGDYRWAATLLDHAVFTDPDDVRVKELYAETLEQLAYGAENGTWRNFFLSGATELRRGNFGTPTSTNVPSMVALLSPRQLFDALSISIDGPRAWGLEIVLDVTLTDLDETWRVALRNGVLIAELTASADEPAQANVSLTKQRLIGLMAGDAESPGVELQGDGDQLWALLEACDERDPDFAIVTP